MDDLQEATVSAVLAAVMVYSGFTSCVTCSYRGPLAFHNREGRCPASGGKVPTCTQTCVLPLFSGQNLLHFLLCVSIYFHNTCKNHNNNKMSNFPQTVVEYTHSMYLLQSNIHTVMRYLIFSSTLRDVCVCMS